MITEKIFKDVITAVLIIGLFILAGLIIKPVAISILFGILLAYIFYPIYRWILAQIKSENLSAFLVCLILLSIVLIPTILILTNVYLGLQETGFVTIKDSILSFLSSSGLSSTLLTNSLNEIIENLKNFVLDLPIILLQFFIVIFVFFFSLRDGRKAIEYLRSLSPLSKEIENKFFMQFKGITNSVLLGQVVVGIIQGLVAGIGYFIFGVPYALILTLLTMLVGIIPLIGPWLVWVPVNIYLFLAGRTGAGLGLLIYGFIIISWLDTIIRPLIVSKRTEINSAIVIIGMIGGLFVFGVLGLILGPLILGYVLLIIEIYRKKRTSESLFFKKIKEEPTKLKNLKKEFLILKDSSR